MQQYLQRLGVVIAVALIAFTPGIARAQQQTKSTEVRKFTVVAVDGNKVVVREGTSTRELTVPPDFRFTVEGKQVSVAELKPGMTGTATITTTTTVTPVTVTEVKNGEVVQASGNSILVKTENGYRMFSPGDVEKRGIKIIKDGKPVDFSGLRAGDRLSATIVTEKPPQVMTERQVQATLSPAAGGACGRRRDGRARRCGDPFHATSATAAARRRGGRGRRARRHGTEASENGERSAAHRNRRRGVSRVRCGADGAETTLRSLTRTSNHRFGFLGSWGFRGSTAELRNPGTPEPRNHHSPAAAAGGSTITASGMRLDAGGSDFRYAKTALRSSSL